jgi:hypothetical protein
VRWHYLLFSVCIFVSSLFANEQDSIYKFISTLYSNYQNSSKVFIFNGPGADTIFSPDLLKLIRMDQSQANGEAGYLDWDPLCDCQDADGIKTIKVNIDKRQNTICAKVTLKYSSEEINIILHLEHINGKWLIANIEEKSVKDLSKYLKERLLHKNNIQK